MSTPTLGELMARAKRPRQRRRAAEALIAAGSDPNATVAAILAQARRDLAHLNAKARPLVQAEQRRGYQRGRV